MPTTAEILNRVWDEANNALKINNGGGGGSSTLQETFDNGQSITMADGDNQTLTITNNDTTNNPLTVEIENAGTGNGLLIDQNGNGVSLNIDSEASTASMVYIDTISTYLGLGIYIGDDETLNYTSIGRGRSNTVATNLFYRNYSSATTAAPVASFVQDNAGDDQAVIAIQQDGSGAGIDFSALSVDKALFKVGADAITVAGAVSHQIPVDIGGTLFYLTAHTHGT
jgi:hypothetical protein